MPAGQLGKARPGSLWRRQGRGGSGKRARVGALRAAACGARGPRLAGCRLTFVVETSRIVVVEGRQLTSEHSARFSLWSPGLRPGEERRGSTGSEGTRRRGERAGRRVGRSKMKAVFANRG